MTDESTELKDSLRELLERIEHQLSTEGRRRSTQEIRFQQETDKHIRRVKTVVGMALALLTPLIGASAWSVQRYDTSTAVLERARAEQDDTTLEELRKSIRDAEKSSEEASSALRAHIDVQKQINDAQRLRSMRSEIMLETLLKKAGKEPPPIEEVERLIHSDNTDSTALR